jgi:hypothetical protein
VAARFLFGRFGSRSIAAAAQTCSSTVISGTQQTSKIVQAAVADLPLQIHAPADTSHDEKSDAACASSVEDA